MKESNSSSKEEEIEKMKSLLQNEIINKNYNKEQFIDYCNSYKPYGDDLSRWTYQELKEVVDKYVQIHKEEENKYINNQMRYGESAKISIFQIQKQVNEINQKLQPTIKPTKKEISCRKIEKSELNDKDIKIIIRNPKAVQTTLFKSDYIVYEVYTSQTEWQVLRRYNDFIWLRQILQKLYPGLYLPPLPGKKMGNRRFETDFVEKRMTFLNLFLNGLLENQVFRASDALISFLSINDRAQLEFKMKQLDSLYSPQRLEDIETLSGKTKILENDSGEQTYQNISNYLKLQMQLLDRINYNLKNYYFNTISACENLEEVQKDFGILTQLNQKVMMKEEIIKTFEELSIFFKNWKRVIYNQNSLMKKYIKQFFKYHSMENLAFHELLDERNQSRIAYEAEQGKLISKKEKLWKQMDINKWEIISFDGIDRFLIFTDRGYAFSKMCTLETAKVLDLYNKVCYYNYSCNNQLKNLIKINRKKFIEDIKEFSQEFYITLNDSLNTWSELGSFVNK